MKTRENTLDTMIVHEVQRRNVYFKHFQLESDARWLDAGAHIGAFAAHIAPHVETVVAYEPDPTNYAMLEENTADFENVIQVNAALVANDDTNRTLYLNTKTNTGSHSFHVKRGRDPIAVDAANISRVIQGLKITHVKLDVEGAERELLGPIVAEPSVRAIVLEWHFNVLRDSTHSEWQAAIELLESTYINVETSNPGPKNWLGMLYAWERRS